VNQQKIQTFETFKSSIKNIDHVKFKKHTIYRKELKNEPFVETIQRCLYNDDDVFQSNEDFESKDGLFNYQRLLYVSLEDL